MAELTSKQRAFVREYLVDSCGAKAVVRAGYSSKQASVQAATLLRIPHVLKAIKAGQRLAEDQSAVKGEEIVRELAAIAFAQAGKVARVEEVGGGYRVVLTATDQLDDAHQRALAEITETPGKYGPAFRVRLHDKLKALEILARIKGLDRPEPVDPGAAGGTVVVRFVPAVPPATSA